jgi:acetyl esterase
MALDPKAKALLTAIAAAAYPPIQELTAAEARSLFEPAMEQLNQPLKQIKSIDILLIQGPGGEIPLRVYTPEGEGPFPVLLFIHGGGWVLYGTHHYDPLCTHLCAGSECLVVSVDYRRSPEAKFPAALYDCLEALQWLSVHAHEIRGDKKKIIIAGDSAGGTLAAGTTMMNRSTGNIPLLGQVLIYPATAWLEPPTPSYIEFAEGYSLTREAMVWFWAMYLENSRQSEDPYAVPMNAESLSGLPNALVIVSGFDPLKDDGVLYAEKLRLHKVPATLLNYGTMIHGFLSYLGILDQAATAVTQICLWLKQRFGSV